MSKKVVTLGEIMLRLSTPDFKRFVQADTFDITYGGGEANVAAWPPSDVARSKCCSGLSDGTTETT